MRRFVVGPHPREEVKSFWFSLCFISQTGHWLQPCGIYVKLLAISSLTAFIWWMGNSSSSATMAAPVVVDASSKHTATVSISCNLNFIATSAKSHFSTHHPQWLQYLRPCSINQYDGQTLKKSHECFFSITTVLHSSRIDPSVCDSVEHSLMHIAKVSLWRGWG